jgi:uroporphyrinogen decarboxylase
MDSRTRVIKALTFCAPDRAPRHLWTLPGVEMFRGPELSRMRALYPEDFANPGVVYGRALQNPRSTAAHDVGDPYRKGRYTDEWGCVWEVFEEGVVGEIKNPLLADWGALEGLHPPREILAIDWNAVEAARASTDRFMLAGTSIRPFERMQFLRGTENLYMDMAWGDARFLKLRSLVHEFFLEELSLWVERDVDGISFMDDWGTQRALLVSPAMWREYYKPLYAEYAALIRGKGKYVFFHSDGNIESIIGDLVEVGVHAMNSQLFCMDIEGLGRRFRGKLAFWGEIDRQKTLPFGTPAQVRAAVMRVRAALDDGRGGLVAQCEWGNKDPFENVAAVFEAWGEPLAAARSGRARG